MNKYFLLATLALAACAGGGDRYGHADTGGHRGSDPITTIGAIATAPLAIADAFVSWKPVQQNDPLPWIAPDKRVPAIAKGQIPTVWDFDNEEYRWVVNDSKVYPFKKYNPVISKFIVKDPISLKWEFAGRGVVWDGDFLPSPYVMPDYEFYLVSIEPMTVVMVPTGVHRRAGFSPSRRKDVSERAAIGIPSIHYATTFPVPAGQLMWFSPDLEVPVQTLAFADDNTGLMTIPGRLRIRCTRAGDTAECVRLKRNAP